MAREVVLYTRAGCTLCDRAKAVLLAAQKKIYFSFREVDIGWEGELFEEHKYDIPVIEIDGKRAFKHRVDPEALAARLKP
jgi:glutaredoxin